MLPFGSVSNCCREQETTVQLMRGFVRVRFWAKDCQDAFLKILRTSSPTARDKKASCRNTSVHAVFLDASKAFNRVLHMKLFKKLIQRKLPLPVCFVRLLKHWYKEETMQLNGTSIFLSRFVCLMELDKGEYRVHTSLVFI